MSPWSFRRRIILVAILPATIIAVLLAAYFLLLRYADAERAFIGRGHALITLLAPAAEYGVFSGNEGELGRLAAALRNEADVSGIVIHDHSGRPLASLGALRLHTNPRQLPDSWSGTADDGKTQFHHTKIWRSRIDLHDSLLAARETAPDRREAVGSVTLEMSRAGLQRLKAEMMAVTLLSALLTLALGSLLALRLASSVTMPVLALQSMVARIRAGDLAARATPHPAGTLRSLEDGINEMAASLQAGRDLLNARIAEATSELEQKRDEAEQASIAKSRFLAAASHDLRQPLHALSLFSAELAETPPGPAQQSLCRQIGAAVGSMEEMLASLLDVSRADLGALQPSVRPIALDDILSRILSAHVGSAGAKGLRLRVHPCRYWGLSDPALLYRMLANLVSNAIRYTERGGILVGVRPAGDMLHVDIWDSGIGIPTEYHSLIYQEFFQVANPERDPRKGLGLGLSLVDRLSGLLGHPVSMRSWPGRGSVFRIALPRADALPRQADETAAANGRRRARLLLVCADASAGDTLAELLAGWDCEVDRLQPSCRGLAPERRPDIVLCEDDAIGEAWPLLHPIASGCSLAVIVLGMLPADLRSPGLDCPVHELSRPLQPAKLRALISHLVNDMFSA